MERSKLNKEQTKALACAKMYYDQARRSESYRKFSSEASRSFKFYHGDQWTEALAAKVRKFDIEPITSNMIAKNINNLQGKIKGRPLRAKFVSSTDSDDDQVLTNALNELLESVHKKQRRSYKLMDKHLDCFICGLGWAQLDVDAHGYHTYDVVNPQLMLYDPADITPQFTNSRFVARTHLLQLAEAKALLPSEAAFFEGLVKENKDSGLLNAFGAPLVQPNSYSVSKTTGYDRIIVAEVQYRVAHEVYTGIDSNGAYFDTFDLDEAVKSKGGLVKGPVRFGRQIRKVMFCDDRLLSYSVMSGAVNGEFSYIPVVWARDAASGAPYGLVHPCISMQINLNERYSRLFSEPYNATVVMDPQSMQSLGGRSVSDAIKGGGVIPIQKHGRFELINRSKLSAEDYQYLLKCEKDIQEAIRPIEDDSFINNSSNRFSYEAHILRQEVIDKSSTHIFNKIRLSLLREAGADLALLQSSSIKNWAVEMVSGLNKQTIVLNFTHDGEVFNSIKELRASISVDIDTSSESHKNSERSKVISIFNLNNGPLLVQSAELLKEFGVQDYAKWAEIFQNIDKGKQPKEQDIKIGEGNG